MISKLKKRENLLFIFFILGIFIFELAWSLILPFNAGPDEKMRYDIPMFIFKHGVLPVGNDPEILDPSWGISYAFTPITPYILSGYLMRLVFFIFKNQNMLLYTARFITIIFSILTIIVNFLIAKNLFKNNILYRWLFLFLTSLWPEFIYISTYVNVDSFAMFCSSLIIYGWVLCMQQNWSYKACAILAIGIGLCSISYYNTYGYIVCSVVLMLLSYFAYKKFATLDYKDFFKKALFIILIVFLISGWWFIRNAILYNGDILGFSTSNLCAEQHAAFYLKPSVLEENLKHIRNLHHITSWFIINLVSFIYIILINNFKYYIFKHYVYIFVYLFYGLILTVGFISIFIFVKQLFPKVKDTKTKNIKLFNLTMLIAIFFPFLIDLYYSFFEDFQPQGRYALPALVPIIYFATLGINELVERHIKNNLIRKTIYTLLMLCCLASAIYCFYMTYKLSGGNL